MEEKELTLAGIDTRELLERLMGNGRLIGLFVKTFLEDQNYADLVAAMESNDMKQAEYAAHTLKGMCGNLSIKPLFQLFQEQVRLLRAGEYDRARAMMTDITAAYEESAEHLRRFIAQG